jgi:hypothetical protein
MYTVNNEGKLNNRAIEPIVYAATYSAADQQEQYSFQLVFASLLVVAMILVNFAVN